MNTQLVLRPGSIMSDCNKPFWQLRKAGKYGEARQLITRDCGDWSKVKAEDAWEIACLIEEGSLGFPQDDHWAYNVCKQAADKGHQAAAMFCANESRFADVEDRYPMPAVETLTCPYAIAMWYDHRGHLPEFTNDIEERARCWELSQRYMKQAAEAGNLCAMAKSDHDAIRRGSLYGHIGCLKLELCMTNANGRFYEIVRSGALQGVQSAGDQIIEAFTGNFTDAEEEAVAKTWTVPWKDGARAILCYPDAVKQHALLKERVQCKPESTPHYWQEMYYYSKSRAWPSSVCFAPVSPCPCCELTDLDKKPLEGRRRFARDDAVLTEALQHIRERVEKPSGRVALLLYYLTRHCRAFPKDVAIILGRLVLSTREEHADVWAETAERN
jgi:hypothetical protein